MTRRVLLAAEGRNELGDWHSFPSYQAKNPLPGVLEALLRKVAPDGWAIHAAVKWRELPFYRAHDRLPKDELNTRALLLHAQDHGCDLIVFARDRDSVKQREIDVQKGRQWLDARAESVGLLVIGTVAVECLEAWLLAVAGAARTENLSRGRAQTELQQAGVVTTEDMVRRIETADLAGLAGDAMSLRSWLRQASTAFS